MSSRQVFGLTGCLLAPASQPACASACVGAFVPVHRCGAVPGSHQVPFSPDLIDLAPRSKNNYGMGVKTESTPYLVSHVQKMAKFQIEIFRTIAGISGSCLRWIQCHYAYHAWRWGLK